MIKKTILALSALLLAAQLNAELIFNFQQVGDDVVMTSSGSIDVSGLVSTTFTSWGGTGTQDFVIHLMGGNSPSNINASYIFHSGTDFSAWTTDNPFSDSWFNYNYVGTKVFSTYAGSDSSGMLAGLSFNSGDLVGSIWTPDQTWTAAGRTLASIGLNVGTYTVTDIVSGQSITYIIGVSAVPEPSTYAGLAGASALLIVLLRRKKMTA
jgi:hypothetical protein